MAIFNGTIRFSLVPMLMTTVASAVLATSCGKAPNGAVTLDGLPTAGIEAMVAAVPVGNRLVALEAINSFTFSGLVTALHGHQASGLNPAQSATLKSLDKVYGNIGGYLKATAVPPSAMASKALIGALEDIRNGSLSFRSARGSLAFVNLTALSVLTHSAANPASGQRTQLGLTGDLWLAGSQVADPQASRIIKEGVQSWYMGQSKGTLGCQKPNENGHSPCIAGQANSSCNLYPEAIVVDRTAESQVNPQTYTKRVTIYPNVGQAVPKNTTASVDTYRGGCHIESEYHDLGRGETSQTEVTKFLEKNLLQPAYWQEMGTRQNKHI